MKVDTYYRDDEFNESDQPAEDDVDNEDDPLCLCGHRLSDHAHADRWDSDYCYACVECETFSAIR